MVLVVLILMSTSYVTRSRVAFPCSVLQQTSLLVEWFFRS